MASSSKIQAPPRSPRSRKRLSILVDEASEANSERQHEERIYFEPDDAILAWMAAGKY